MNTLVAAQLFHIRVLVTRESAHSVKRAIQEALRDQRPALAIDFSGIEGMTPSFVDELLLVVEQSLKQEGIEATPVLTFVNPPTRLSAKFAAIGRAHGLHVSEATDGSWKLSVPAPLAT